MKTKFNSFGDLGNLLTDEEKKIREEKYRPTATKEIVEPKVESMANKPTIKKVEKQVEKPKVEVDYETVKDIVGKNTSKKWSISSIKKYLKATDTKATVNSDGIVSIDGNFKVIGLRGELPFKINKISGNFVWNGSYLTTFKNFPNEIGGDIMIANMLVHRLNNFPQIIGGDITLLSSKQLSDVSGLPKSMKNVDLSNCGLKSLGFADGKTITGDLNVSNNKLAAVALDIEGKIDASSNFITTKNEKLDGVDYSNNPCQPDDGMDTARW